MSDRERELIASGTVEAVTTPADGATLHHGLGVHCRWSGAEGLVIAQNADTGEQHLTDLQVRRLDGDVGYDAVQGSTPPVEPLNRAWGALQHPPDLSSAVREPHPYAAVAGRESNQDARITPGANHQVRGHAILAYETVDVETFIHLVV